MKRLLTILLSLMLISLSLCSCAQVAELSKDQLQYIRSEYDRRMRQMDFQGAVCTTYQGEEIYAGGTGKANKKEDIDNSADIVYGFASITKQFTAAAILMLNDEEKLHLSDTIDLYFPDYPYGNDITIHHLLCMRSGIPDYVNINDKTGMAVRMYSDADIPYHISIDNSSEENRKNIEEWIFSQPLLFTPGEKYDYSSSNYMLLGEIIEQLTQEGYHAFVQNRIFDPLGMTSAGFCDDYAVDGFTLAKGYHSEGGDWSYIGGVRFAAWDLMCSPKDMAKWGEALMGGDILSEKAYQLMTTDYSDEDDPVQYCYGLMVESTSYGKVFYHNGHVPSFYSMLVLIPKEKLVNVTTSNYACDNAASFNIKLCEAVIKAIKNEYDAE